MKDPVIAAPDRCLLDHLETYGSGLAIGVASVLVVAGVILRYVLSYSHSALDEVTRYLVVWGTMLGASRLVRKGGHVTVDILVVLLSPRGRVVLQCIAIALGIVFCVLLAWLGGRLCWQSFVLNATSASALALPMWIPQAAIPAGAALMAVRFMQAFMRALGQVRPTASDRKQA